MNRRQLPSILTEILRNGQNLRTARETQAAEAFVLGYGSPEELIRVKRRVRLARLRSPTRP